MSADDWVAVAVDPDICVGIGACVAAEPDAFDLGDDGVASVKRSARLSRDRADAVVSGCPSNAIRVVEHEAT